MLVEGIAIVRDANEKAAEHYRRIGLMKTTFFVTFENYIQLRQGEEIEIAANQFIRLDSEHTSKKSKTNRDSHSLKPLPGQKEFSFNEK